MKGIPQKMIAYNAYANGNKLIGVTGEVETPEIEFMSDTVNGAGIGGEIDAVVMGIVSAMEMEVPFTDVTGSMFDICQKGKVAELTLRGSEQTQDSSTGLIVKIPVKCGVRGMVKKIKPGKYGTGIAMESSVTLAVHYIKIEVDNETVLEIDPLNMVCNINGEDVLEEVRNQI